MEELCERFNIDRTRLYMTGQSMGGGGTTLWYTCFPEFMAASCGRAGWLHHQKKQANLLNKPIMIIQGEKDEKFRVDSKHAFLKMAESCNGNVTNISYPDLPEVPSLLRGERERPRAGLRRDPGCGAQVAEVAATQRPISAARRGRVRRRWPFGVMSGRQVG